MNVFGQGRLPARLVSARLREDGGFALIEVLVSAALMIVVAIGVLGGIDGPSRVAQTNQARAIAADLAQQDQERMRGMKVSDISNLYQSRSVQVATGATGGAPVTYTVTSRAEWASDSSGTVSCTSAAQDADYLRIQSRVSWPSMGNGKPVELRSLVAPPNSGFAAGRGAASVQVLDELDKPVVNLPVGLTGPVSLNAPTNELGCAFFGNILPGSYQATFSKAGWVDPSGTQNVVLGPTVTAGSTGTVNKSYAPSAAVNVAFETRVSGVLKPTAGYSVSAPSSGPPSIVRVFSNPSGSAMTAGSLFPFPSGYAFFAGTCSDSNPTSSNVNYFTATDPQAFVNTVRGTVYSIKVREPAINLRVLNGTPVAGAQVTIKPGGACGDTYPTAVTNAQGALDDPGMPFGNYTVCASAGGKYKQAAVANTNPNGTATVDLDLATGTTGTCP